MGAGVVLRRAADCVRVAVTKRIGFFFLSLLLFVVFFDLGFLVVLVECSELFFSKFF